jgi:hypothetical protein
MNKEYMRIILAPLVQTPVIKAATASLLVFAIHLSKCEATYPWHYVAAGRSM